MERFVIYGLTEPNGELRYIGKSTTGAAQRLASHLCPSSLRDKTHKNHWIKSLLKRGQRPEAFVIEAFDSKAQLSEAERHHIAQFRSLGCRLTNLSPGGDGEGVPCSPEKRAKLSAATKGRRLCVRSAESYVAQGLKMRGRKRSASAIAKTAAAKRGQKHTAEALAKMSAAAQRRNATPGRSEKLSRAHGGRPFVDQHGRRYESQGAAARELGLSAGHINQVLFGKRKHTKGFIFTFIEN